ncbi:hypothetical protein [Salmonella phage phC17]|uniref:Uncharacterized protein n=2 Tax=Tequintavirus TaxID=187218 RepID=A0AAF0JZJ8_9CAUD|nr:hypothetical protein [Salmonella phage phB7]WGG14743.1 hypothetical protein [Salmonella phage phC17]
MEWVIIGIFVLLILLFVGLRVIDNSVTQAEIKLMQLSTRGCDYWAMYSR